MGRKSRNLDKKLLRIGAQILRQKGASGLSMREVAHRAHVNLGMLSYYFKNKNDFIQKILEEAYAPFIHQLLTSQKFPNDLEEILFQMAAFSRDHQTYLLSLFADILTREKNVIRFLQKNFTDHFEILHQSLTKHFNEKGYDMTHYDHAYRYLIAVTGLPNLLAGIRSQLSGQKKPVTDNDERLRKRIQASIKGLDIICQ